MSVNILNYWKDTNNLFVLFWVNGWIMGVTVECFIITFEYVPLSNHSSQIRLPACTIKNCLKTKIKPPFPQKI